MKERNEGVSSDACRRNGIYELVPLRIIFQTRLVRTRPNVVNKTT